jgi:hypothetical protein
VIANFQIGPRIFRYRYCSERCKVEHRLQLMRSAGL